jgi:hypothetical protein
MVCLNAQSIKVIDSGAEENIIDKAAFDKFKIIYT